LLLDSWFFGLDGLQAFGYKPSRGVSSELAGFLWCGAKCLINFQRGCVSEFTVRARRRAAAHCRADGLFETSATKTKLYRKGFSFAIDIQAKAAIIGMR
jgi:hypothetical protein